MQNAKPDINQALFDWNGPMGLPDFSRIDSGDFADGFKVALAEDRADIDAIAENAAEPDFDNTIVALELAGRKLSRISAIFWNLIGANSNETLRGLETEIAPIMSRHGSETAANKPLFKRIDTLWQNRKALDLSVEQTRVLERYWKGFVRGGAALADDDQKSLATINARLAELGAQFSQNILADESSWAMGLTEGDDLAGLPDFLKSAMRSAAREREIDEPYAVTLSRSIIEPFLTFSTNRALREKAFKAWASRGEGENDNRPLIAEILALRQEKATLLGYKNFAYFKLEDQMAKEPNAVFELLDAVWDKARAKAGAEEQDLAALAAEEGANHAIEPHDWRHYAEKLRVQRFNFDEAELKAYLPLDSVIEAAFDVAHRLFGIRIEQREGVSAYHDEVRVFEVLNADGSHRAVFMGDYFARPSKRSGAWMSGYRGQHKLPLPYGQQGQTPIIVNVMNFAKAAEGEQTLLSMDDAETLFHEFGHALHGILSDVTYPRVSGTAVARDFVELPSQLFEHWLTVPKVLAKHATHVETGEPMPKALLDKVLAARTFDAGFGAVEFTASALVDMKLHTAATPPRDVVAFERAVLDEIGMPSAIAMRHRVPHFAHVFSGDGYSAGYYSYMWSEVLDADAFAAFEETGNVFDEKTAQKLHDHVYAAGGAIDPQETYLAFRGQMPSVDAMIAKRGLSAAG